MNGCIFVMGGRNKSFVHLNSIEMYDPNTNKWQSISSPSTASLVAQSTLPTPLEWFGSVVVGDSIIVMGGHDGQLKANSMCWDVKINKWRNLPDMPHALVGFACSVMGDKIYVAGKCSNLSSDLYT